MIISHKHKFIFIKTQKTAGTSIEVALSKYCGDDDVITPVIPAVTGHEPRNYKKFYQLKGFYNHMPASEIMQKVSPELWCSYYKFCFERNPFDKAVSVYFWHKLHDKFNLDFKEFCYRSHEGNFRYVLPVDFDKYGTEENDKKKTLKLLVDFVGKYETLSSDLSQICDKLKIPFDGILTREKGEARTQRIHYSKYYDPQTVEIVSSEFRREIALFGYAFESEPVIPGQ